MAKANKKDARRSSAGAARADDEAGPRSDQATRGARRTKRGKPEPVGKSGVPGSKHDARRCTAIANRTGERCRAAAIKGGTVCRVHGGSLPGVKKAAKERLLALVDPALVALQRVLTNPDADDSTKVRAALGILDRTGFRPGLVVEVDPSDKWSGLLDSATMRDNRSLGGGGENPELVAHAVRQLALDAQADAWREYDAEDAEPYNGPSRIDPDEDTIRGEVVVGRYDVPADRAPDDPPRYAANPPEADR